MIGRVYKLGGQFWRVLARGEPFDRGPRRNVLLERVAPAPEGCPAGFWLFVDPDGRKWYRGPERTIRPFRGLRRA